MIHDFQQNLEYSLGAQEKFDINILKKIFNIDDIQKTTVEVDKTGIDYIATLRRGGTINIDAKTRKPGASKFWDYGEPDLALEIYSSIPDGSYPGKIGWTLNEASEVDYVLYTFDKSDSDKFYFLPFQLLRNGFRQRYNEWTKKYFKKYQPNKGYLSQAVFVPASVVIAEINRQMTGTAHY